MGYGGQTVNGLSSLGPKMGKAHGGGVKLEQGMGKISQSQDDVLSGKETQMEDNSMGSAKMISGSHSKGGFMKHSKSSYGASKANYDKDMAEERIQISDDKKKIYQDDKEKRASSPTKLKGGQVKLDKNKNGKIDGEDFKMMKK